MMGDAFDDAAPPTIPVNVRGTSLIQAVETIKDGNLVYLTQPNTAKVQFDFTDTAASGLSWYYVRVIENARNMAWSSPRWVKYTAR